MKAIRIYTIIFICISSLFSIATADDDWNQHCHMWPPQGVPPEHKNEACDRELQNKQWANDHITAESAPPEDLIPHDVYLNLPEEKTWICPLDTADDVGSESNIHRGIDIDGQKSNVHQTGHPTRWILHNKASNPIIITFINSLGLEVSAMDKSTYPAHSNTSVYPRGSIVLPNTLAVIDGLQGQTFIVREYKEVLPMDAMMNEEKHQHSWNSFKKVLPSTLSFLTGSRYETNKGVIHVLGEPGRILMKHRMGNIFVKNQLGALCPDGAVGGDTPGNSFFSGILNWLGVGRGEDNTVGDDRQGLPKDFNPDCNVMRKSFINKVGCPVDIYFAPGNKQMEAGEDYNCETFTKHLGDLDTFLAMDSTTRDVDGPLSPLKFENTYNGHNFVVRMSHDNSLVARIELDHDVVSDCPEPKRNGAFVAVQADERLLSSLPVNNMMLEVNATNSVYNSSCNLLSEVKAKVNTKARKKEMVQGKSDLLYSANNHTGITLGVVPLIS